MSDACIHIANLFYLASFLLRDMFWLRALSCCGLIFGIAFFTTCQPTPMYGPMFWHVTFLLINIYQIYHLLAERRRLQLSREETVISRGMLHGLSDDELAASLAHSLATGDDDVRIITDADGHRLAPDAAVLRDIAIRRLSRAELINLLSRRIWQSLKEVSPHH